MKKVILALALSISLAGCVTVAQFISLVQAAVPIACKGVVPIGETITDFVLAYLNGGQPPAESEAAAEALAKQVASSLCNAMQPATQGRLFRFARAHRGQPVSFGTMVVNGHPVRLRGVYR